MTVQYEISGVRKADAHESEFLQQVRTAVISNQGMPFLAPLGFRLTYRIGDGMVEAGLGPGIITRRGMVVIDIEAYRKMGLGFAAGHMTHLWLHWLFNHYDRSINMGNEFGAGILYADVWNIMACCSSVQGVNETLPRFIDTPSFDELGDNEITVPEKVRQSTEDAYRWAVEFLTDQKLSKEGAQSVLPDNFDMGDFEKALEDADSEAEEEGDSEDDLPEFDFDAPIDDISSLPPEALSQGWNPFDGRFNYCGSGAGNESLAGEAGLEAEAAGEGDMPLEDWEANAVRTDVAGAAKDHYEKSRGDMPAEMERFVDEQLRPPTVDWAQQLRNAVMNPIWKKIGQTDFSFMKPHRRSHGSDFILPASVGSEPGKIGVAVDTSGSMSEKDLAAALSEIEGITTGNQIKVKGYAVDAACVCIGDVVDASKFKLLGGGGTDMGIAIRHVAEEQPQEITCLVVITDGYTPWPQEVPDEQPDLFVVAAIITDLDEEDSIFTGVPDWIETVKIPQTDL